MLWRFDIMGGMLLSLFLHGAVAYSLLGSSVLSTYTRGGSGAVFSVSILPSPSEPGMADSNAATPKPEEAGDMVVQPTKMAEVAPKPKRLLPPVKRSVAAKQPVTARPPAERRLIRPATFVGPAEGSAACSHPPCTGGSGGDAPAPIDGAAQGDLLLVQAPKPPYPWAARRAGFEGRVVLDVNVAPSGKVQSARIRTSSGRKDCDEAARETVQRRWQFEPLRVAGVGLPSHTRVAVVYFLE